MAEQSLLAELRGLVNELRDLGKDEEVVAKECFKQADDLTKEEVFKDWIRTEVRHGNRRITRKKEKEATRNRRRARTRATEAEARDRTADLITTMLFTKELLASKFPLRGQPDVVWGEATLQNHNTALAAMGSHIAGCQETYDLHDLAIKKIARAGVTCLNEVPPEMLAA